MVLRDGQRPRCEASSGVADTGASSQRETTMPIVDMKMLEGFSDSQKEAMYAEVTDALCRTLGCRPDQVRIMVSDLAPRDFAVAGKSLAAARREAAGG
ncbi:MAG: tautomerase family protein [Hoeflea sp.]|nr:tautomerase family protein [Hoeflea sp.]MDP2121710.1 tautomerase family protein [Hoeflea sp.]MDP3525214.1 tautomerase family protein [Hoeflea sp.]